VESLINFIAKINDFILLIIKTIFGLIKDVVSDALVWILDPIFGWLGDRIASIPAPSFFNSGVSVSSLLSGFPPFAQFVIGQMGLPEAFLIVGAGVTFRLVRKLFTLGQW